jgi:hypothetical protein
MLMALQLINGFVVSRIDYCNSLLAGQPVCQLNRIQSVLNYAARLVYGCGKFDHVTPLLRDNLHWLRVPESVLQVLPHCLQGIKRHCTDAYYTVFPENVGDTSVNPAFCRS